MPNARDAQETVERALFEIRRVIAGQDRMLERVLVCLLSGGHLLIEGVPGLAKTLTIKTTAAVLGGSFKRVQYTPDLDPSDLVGTRIYRPDQGTFETELGPVFCNFLLADEINRAPAKTQAALLEVMQEYQVTLEGETHRLERPFFVLATQNPVETEGTYPLPEAQLDRFLLKLEIGYPSHRDEAAIVVRTTHGQRGEQLPLEAVAECVDARELLALQDLASGVRVDDRVIDYAVRIGRATRGGLGLAAGAGPRGAIAMVRAARAAALVAGRDFVTPDDVKRCALPALRHRVLLAPDAQLEGRRVDDLLAELLATVEAPRL
nr:MoxR family ATPase [Caldimonas sp.]